MEKRSIYRLVIVVWTLVFSLSLLTLASAQDNAAPYLGISFEAADEGVEVIATAPNSPAETAGLQAGDIITAIDDEAVTAETIAEVVAGYAVDDTIVVTVNRDGENLDLEVTLAERPENFVPARPERPGQREARQERAYLGIALDDQDGAVVIAEVADDSPASEAGLQVDDVLVSINGEAVSSGTDAVRMIRALNPGDTVTLEIERDGETQTLDVELASIVVEESFAGVLPFDVVMYDMNNEAWLVVALAEDSPLAAAGVQAGDAITEIAIDGEAVTVDELAETLNNAADDAEAELTIERDDETLTVTVAAADLNAQFEMGRTPRMDGRGVIPFDNGRMMGGNVRLGVGFSMLDEELAAENDLDITEGALINEVLEDSPAAAAGIQVGDVITAVDGDVVDARRDLRERLYAYEPDDVVTLDVLRDGETLSLEATLEAGGMNFNSERMPFGFQFDGEGAPFFFGPDGTFEFGLPQPPDMPEVDPALPVT